MANNAFYTLLIKELEGLKITHNYCEDSWYSCPKSEDGCADDREGHDCNCGADYHNGKVENIISAIKGIYESD